VQQRERDKQKFKEDSIIIYKEAKTKKIKRRKNANQ
jgi:hypothetical protein